MTYLTCSVRPHEGHPAALASRGPRGSAAPGFPFPGHERSFPACLSVRPRESGDPVLGPGFPLEFTPAKAGAGMNGVLLRLLRPVSAAPLLPRDQPQPEAARREANRR